MKCEDLQPNVICQTTSKKKKTMDYFGGGGETNKTRLGFDFSKIALGKQFYSHTYK